MAFIVFGVIAKEIVLEKEGFFDAAVFRGLSPYISPFHTRMALLITFFGNGLFLFPAYSVIVFYLIRSGRKKYAVMTIAIAMVSMLLNYLLKALFHRPRPLLVHLDIADGYSFPSGHSEGASTLCGILIYLVWKTGYMYYSKILISLGLLLFAFFVGLSRVYLHVHFASDVIGGFCVTLAWLTLFFIGMELVNTGNKQEHVI